MIHKIFYNICAFLFRIFICFKCRPKIIGKENMPKKGKAILIANHQSNYDFIAMALGTKRHVHFLAKKSLFKGILKPIMRGVEAIPVDRNTKNPKSIEKALFYLNKGEVIGIFPEGTFREKEETLKDFKIGAVKLAKESNAPIIPISILGCYSRKKLIIKIDKPFYLKSNDLKKENNILRNIILENIRGKS